MELRKRITKRCNTTFIISIIFVIVGLFLFIKPNTTISVISYAIGGFLLVSGIFSIYKYFSQDGLMNTFNFELVYGVLLSIAGLFLIFNPNLLATLFPIILGIWIIINSVTKFQYALVLKRVNNNDWPYTCLISFLTFAWGLVLLFNPLESVLAVTQIIGIFIIVYAVLDIIDNFIIRKNVSDIIDVFNREKE